MAKAKQVRTRYPGIYKVGDRYEWKIGRHARGMTDTLDEARETRAKAELNGPAPAIVRGGFGEYGRTWVAGYQGRTSRGFSEGTRTDYRDSLEVYAIPFFEGKHRLAPHQIQRRHVKAFIAWLAVEPTAAERKAEIGLRRPLARRTIVKHLAPIKAMFADAVEDDDLNVNPALVRVNVTSTEEPDEDKARAFTDAQLAAVLDAALENDRLLFDTVAATGARFGEWCEWRGKDLARGTDGPVLRVRRAYSDKAKDANGRRLPIVKLPKSDNGRRDLPLDPELARRLWRLQRAPDELLFKAPQGGRISWHNNYGRVLTPALERATVKLEEAGLNGVTWAGWHTFRHTAASRLFAAGRNVKQVQEWLGHHKASFTLDTYIHLMGGGLGEPLELPAGGLGGIQGGSKLPDTAGGAGVELEAESGELQA